MAWAAAPKKCPTVLPLHVGAAHQTHVRLMNERSGLQGLADHLFLHLTAGQAAKLLVHNRQQLC
jgi:hypothetical protein